MMMVYPAAGEGSTTLPESLNIDASSYLIVNVWNDPEFSLWMIPSYLNMDEFGFDRRGKISE